MERDADVLSIAQKLYPAAVLMLGAPAEGRAAVIEAIAAAKRRSPEQWTESVLSHLLRIGMTRAPERADPDAMPADAVPEPLYPVLRLPVGSRISLALELSGVDAADAAAARGLTAEEQSQSVDKAFRQLQFLHSGDAPSREQLAEFARKLQLQDADADALFAALAENAETESQTGSAEPPIIRIPAAETKRKTIPVPVWCIAAAAVGLIALSAALIFRIAADRNPEGLREPEPLVQSEVGELFSQDYLYIGTAQEKAAAAAGIPAEQAVFLSTKLKTASEPPIYEMQFTDGSRLCACIADAKTGEISDLQDTAAELQIPVSRLKTPESLRKAAAETFSLRDIIILKEKLSHGSYEDELRLDLLDKSGIVHTVMFDAVTGALLKYKKERLADSVQGSIISPEKAKKLAVARVSGESVSEMIFTKIKQDGELYTVAFTMDDGTQYLVELNAVSGVVSNVDVHPVSADISDAVGLLAAKDTALALANHSDEQGVVFTKAKIDRSSGIYVYELEFETYDYEYEVSIAVQDGTPVKFRAWETE